MAPLEQQQQQQVADHSVLSQRLDIPQVDMPPEESSVNLTQLVPELDLLGDKGKDKKDESDEEEVRKGKQLSGPLEHTLYFVVDCTHLAVTHFASLFKI